MKAVDYGGGSDSGSGVAGPLGSVIGWHMLIRREVLVYLAEHDQLDVNDFDLLRFWNQHGTDKVMPSAEISYLVLIT